MGLEQINAMTVQKRYKLRIRLTDQDGNLGEGVYEYFFLRKHVRNISIFFIIYFFYYLTYGSFLTLCHFIEHRSMKSHFQENFALYIGKFDGVMTSGYEK